MNGGKPTVVIDKSFFQSVCSAPKNERDLLWKEIAGRYQIIIPFILVEEIWTNLAKLGNKNPFVIMEMVIALREMCACWIDDEVEIVFKELVQRKQIKTFPPPSQEIVTRLMAGMFYFYAPLCRVQPTPSATPKKIIERKFSEQRNNFADQSYVACALICDRILTQDEGMANIMQAFKKCSMWRGEVLFINPRQPLNAQLPRLLI
jgi:hypothetical protein